MDKKSRDLVMGKLYLKNKDYKMAEKSLLDYLNLSPEDFQALKMLAQVYENLNNYLKAFEFYERSYLVEPERKGTLLDICRLLLMNNSGLDHVDRKKWLKLAVQAFPTNPIVTSLRDTLPVFESNQAPSKINLESALMSKLDLLEQRLTGIEEALSRLSVLKEPVSFPQFSTTNNTVEPAKLPPQPIQFTVSKNEPPAKPLAQPIQFSLSKVEQSTRPPAQPLQLSLSKNEEPAKPPAQPLLFSLSKAEQPAKPLAQPMQFPLSKTEQPSKPLAQPIQFAASKTEEPAKPLAQPIQFTASKTEEPSKPLAQAIQFTSSKAEEPAKTPAQPIQFTNSKIDEAANFTFGLGGGGSNLFANGLKKFNLPTEGSWTTAPAKNFPLFGLNAGTSNESADAPKPTTESNAEKEDDGDDGVVEAPELPIENTCDMQPIEIKSGEEDEDIIFEQRCKLFRFRDKEYKERGLGNIKALKHRTTGAGRLIMRRDLINLVCLNCWSCSKIERVRDTQVRFAGLDASDGEPVMTVFLAKFKTQELTDTFMSHLTELFPDE